MAKRVEKFAYLMAYCRYINKMLKNDPDCRPYLPLDPFNDDLYKTTKNGVVLCKLVNIAFPRAIDERAVHKNTIIFYPSQMVDNVLLALTAAQCNGCPVSDFVVDDLTNNSALSRCIILEVVWQIIKCGFFRRMNLHEHPELCKLKQTEEDILDVKCVPPEDLLMRYVNFHLKWAGVDKRLNDIGIELADCVIYAHLLPAIAPVTIRGRLIPPGQVLVDENIANRAKAVLQNLREMEADMFLCLNDFTDSHIHLQSRARLHLATIAYLFLQFPGELTNPRRMNEHPEQEEVSELSSRNFENSCAVTPFVTHSCASLRDGLISKQLFEVLRTGSTKGLKFITEFQQIRKIAQYIYNNTNVVRLVQGYPLPLPHLDSEKLSRTDKPCCLSLLLELLRSYIAKDHYDEDELLRWTNEQLYRAGRSVELRSFNDRAIVEENLFAVVLNNLTNGMADSRHLTSKKLDNAAYSISVAHKAGYPVYTRPEHFISCNGAFVALAFATLRWHPPRH
ncbi:hypothetical protein T265_02436 [Opisthorchis viverrini]|uniref:Calponin-homology (CH) domain-containing protein n=1 Tax=Opisthorchis viverrini TaxID=6198 RepID=A0A074ZUW8_OPIVI|nr:hypothetical protein T265_02436 [Opisthorchis viverrini]KER31243.1 hypothetical protein T265_02436 [Opisthorchis viverrini]